MPWWSWVLIWGGIVLIQLGVLALLAWWLLGKVRRLGVQAEQLQALIDELEERAEQLVQPTQLARPAVARDRDEVADEFRRRRRLVDREKAERKERRLERARMLTTANPMKFAHIARRK